MARPRVAFFDFSCCEGCQLCVIDLTPEQLLDLIAVVDIVEFREAISEQSDAYDIAIVELDEGIKITARVKKVEEELIKIGDPVQFLKKDEIGYWFKK